MARKPDRLHENFRKALEEAPLHSPLGRWIVRHRAEMEKLLRGRQPDWAKMAETFGKAGLRDENDRRPTAESAERAWRMVRSLSASGRQDGQHRRRAAAPPSASLRSRQ
jgi:hypothetical protein